MLAPFASLLRLLLGFVPQRIGQSSLRLALPELLHVEWHPLLITPNSVIAAFLAAVRPRFGVISSGYHNSFGHPRPEVLQRLQAAHVATFRTDRFGATTFYLDGTNVSAVVRGETITPLPH